MLTSQVGRPLPGAGGTAQRFRSPWSAESGRDLPPPKLLHSRPARWRRQSRQRPLTTARPPCCPHCARLLQRWPTCAASRSYWTTCGGGSAAARGMPRWGSWGTLTPPRSSTWRWVVGGLHLQGQPSWGEHDSACDAPGARASRQRRPYAPSPRLAAHRAARCPPCPACAGAEAGGAGAEPAGGGHGAQGGVLPGGHEAADEGGPGRAGGEEGLDRRRTGVPGAGCSGAGRREVRGAAPGESSRLRLPSRTQTGTLVACRRSCGCRWGRRCRTTRTKCGRSCRK